MLCVPWLTINPRQLHAPTRRTNSGTFWSFHLLSCHTHVPVAAKLHHTQVNKVKRTTYMWWFFFILVLSFSRFICSFCNQNTPQLLQMTHYHFLSLCVSGGSVLSVQRQCNPEGAGLNQRLSQHTFWDPSHSLTPSRNSRTIPRARKQGKQGHITVLLQSHYVVCDVMMLAKQLIWRKFKVYWLNLDRIYSYNLWGLLSACYPLLLLQTHFI